MSEGPEMHPESFNTPSDTLRSLKELDTSIRKLLESIGKGEGEGPVQSSSSSLHFKE